MGGWGRIQSLSGSRVTNEGDGCERGSRIGWLENCSGADGGATVQARGARHRGRHRSGTREVGENCREFHGGRIFRNFIGSERVVYKMEGIKKYVEFDPFQRFRIESIFFAWSARASRGPKNNNATWVLFFRGGGVRGGPPGERPAQCIPKANTSAARRRLSGLLLN